MKSKHVAFVLVVGLGMGVSGQTVPSAPDCTRTVLAKGFFVPQSQTSPVVAQSSAAQQPSPPSQQPSQPSQQPAEQSQPIGRSKADTRDLAQQDTLPPRKDISRELKELSYARYAGELMKAMTNLLRKLDFNPDRLNPVFEGLALPDSPRQIEVHLHQGKRYAFVGVCDGACKELVVAVTSTDKPLSEEAVLGGCRSQIPVFLVAAPRDETALLTAMMTRCEPLGLERCGYLVSIFECVGPACANLQELSFKPSTKRREWLLELK